MNKNQVRALIAVNLRLVNPQVTDRYRKKGKNGSELTKKLSLQFLTNALLFMFIYGFTMLEMNFSKLPGMFTFYVGLFVLLAFSQSISGIYNVFFAGKDLASYLPLPFRQKEIFLSKIIIVSLNVIPFTLPLLVAFFITGWRSGMMISLAILMAIVVYLLILVIILLMCSLIVFGLTKTKIFREHQTMVMNILMALTLVIASVGILMMNGRDNYSSTGATLDRTPIDIFLPLYKIFKTPLSAESGMSWLGIVGLLLIFGVLLKYIILPHLNEQLTIANSALVNSNQKHKRVHRRSVAKMLDAYNLQLLKEPNLLLQVLSNSIMIPIIFIFSFAFTDLPSNLPLKWMGVFFVGGIVFSGITINQASLISNLISLDRMNFEFVKSLPISMKKYLQRKFLLGYLFQIVINMIVILIAAIILKINWVMALALITGSILGTYLISQHYFSRDYRLRLTNWTNVTQLFSRGGGNFGMAATMLLNIIVGLVIIVSYSLVIAFMSQSLMINVIVMLLIIIGSIFIRRYYQQKFWNKFEI